MATAVLHTMLMNANDPLPMDENLLNEDLLQEVPVLPVRQAGNVVRRTLIETFFHLKSLYYFLI